MRDNLFYIKSSKSIEIQKEKEIILEIDLGTKYSHAGIMKMRMLLYSLMNFQMIEEYHQWFVL